MHEARGERTLPLFHMNAERRIFIIDDEVSLLSVLKTYFETCGLTAYAFEEPTGLERELAEKKPHAILLDIVFPNTSGVKIIQQIKQANPDIPVIMMTGYANDEDKIECLRRGAYAILHKPFDSYEELFHTVNNAISHYMEMMRTMELTAEVQKTHDLEKLNLLELDFLKSLQHMIGETEDTSVVLKNFFTLLKSFLDFDMLATLIKERDDVNIQIYPKIETKKEILSFISATLSETMPDSWSEEGKTRVTTDSDGEITLVQGNNYSYITVDLSTNSKIFGHAGLYRIAPFDVNEEAIFNRFCSHIAVALEKIGLFKEIKILSVCDGLTNLFNHAYAMKALGEEIERSKRYNSLLSIILFDIDDFKQVNDTYGHLAGDYVLSRVSQLLKEGLRTIDMVARYGGEEFLAILPETEKFRAYTVAERLRSDVEAEIFTYEDQVINLTISGGIAPYVLDADLNKLIKKADDNLYKAKREGKNRIYYDKE